MARWSNNVTACINFLTLLIGLSLLAIGSLQANDQKTCISLIQIPCLRIGGILVVISFIGLIGSCTRSCFLLWVYLVLYIVLIMMVAVGIVLWITVMGRGKVRLDMGEDRSLNDYTFWFQDQVMGLAEWPKVRQCLVRKNICSSNGHHNSFLFSKNIKDGCCQPPSKCDENFLTKHDCGSWRNSTQIMCYDCTSCAAGFVTQLSVLWKRLFPGMVALLVILIAIFILGCSAFRQNKADKYKKLYQNNAKA